MQINLPSYLLIVSIYAWVKLVLLSWVFSQGKFSTGLSVIEANIMIISLCLSHLPHLLSQSSRYNISVDIDILTPSNIGKLLLGQPGLRMLLRILPENSPRQSKPGIHCRHSGSSSKPHRTSIMLLSLHKSASSLDCQVNLATYIQEWWFLAFICTCNPWQDPWMPVGPDHVGTFNVLKYTSPMFLGFPTQVILLEYIIQPLNTIPRYKPEVSTE